MFIRFAMIHERDGRTDGQTPHHSIYRAYAYASHGKNNRCKYLSVFHKIPGPRIIRWYKQIAAKLLSLSINQSINQKRIRVTKVTTVTVRPLLQC